MIKVLFDHLVFSFQEYGGISRYYSQLYQYFNTAKEVSAEILIQYSNNFYLKNLLLQTPKPFFASRRFIGRNELIRLLNQWYFKKEFSTHSPPDIFHPTYYHKYFLDIIGDVPFALTIYDMAHERYPHHFHPLDFTIKNKKALAERANRIIAISENTKSDIVSLLHIPESRIDVIPLAADISVEHAKNIVVQTPEKYILYVGARNTYKNFFFFLRAAREVLKSESDIRIVCAGGGKFTKSELQEIERLNISDKIHHMNATDGVLAFLYNNALAFVYPSLYEGFGIPILEAFSCGVPVLLSNRSSFPEVGGDAASYFDPENLESLIEVLRKAVLKESLREEYTARGFERAKLFSWKKTAEMTKETYLRILSNKKQS